MGAYWFKAYFKYHVTDKPFVLQMVRIGETLEVARQTAFADCRQYEKEYACKLLYLYTDTDMKEGAANEN